MPPRDPPNIRLRPVSRGDLPLLYEMQTDPESNAMAGTKPRTREAFFAGWERNFADPGVNGRVIEVVSGESGGSGGGPGGERPTIVGTIARFQADGRDNVGYWIARPHWGRGIASRALSLFLAEETRRPLYATTASANTTSRLILERCGFRCTGLHMGAETDRYLAREVAGYVLD